MILTGKNLEATAKAVWGENWIAVLSRKLKCSRKTIARWRDEETAMPADLRRCLVDLMNEQMAIIAEKHSLLSEVWDDAA